MAFDLLYWNADSTNLPGPMYCYYLRNTYLANKLREPGALTNCGVPVDLGKVKLPVFVLATREDHIVPWRSAYRTLGLLGGRTRPSSSARAATLPAWSIRRQEQAQLLGRHAVSGRRRRWLQNSAEKPGSWWPVLERMARPAQGRRARGTERRR